MQLYTCAFGLLQVFVNAGESDEPRCIDGTVVHADQKADLVLLQVMVLLKSLQRGSRLCCLLLVLPAASAATKRQKLTPPLMYARCCKHLFVYKLCSRLRLVQVPEALKAPPLDAQLSPGQRYFILGQSAQAQPDASSVSHGIIAATQPDACSHVRGDTKAGLGDLGAGCFAVDTGRLIGMIVGVDPNAHKSVLVPGAVIAHALSMVTPAA